MHKKYFVCICVIVLFLCMIKSEYTVVWLVLLAMHVIAFFRTERLVDTKKGREEDDKNRDS